jgi:hypothetical protein
MPPQAAIAEKYREKYRIAVAPKVWREKTGSVILSMIIHSLGKSTKEFGC